MSSRHETDANVFVLDTVSPQWDAMKLSLMIEEANKISAKLRKNTVFSRCVSFQFQPKLGLYDSKVSVIVM